MADTTALCPELVYATKGNIYAPEGSSAATIVAVAKARLEDALASSDPRVTDITVTINADTVTVAD